MVSTDTSNTSLDYKIFPEKRYLEVKSTCKKTLVLEFRGKKVHLNVLNNEQDLWMCEYTAPPSIFDRADGVKTKVVELSFATFTVVRKNDVFSVGWKKDENWKLVP